jgi:hypothetical protein
MPENVLIIGGPRHGEQVPYMGSRMALPDVAPATEPDDSPAGTAPIADETPQAMTSYVVRELYVSGKDGPGKQVQVASPAAMSLDEVLDLMARRMEGQARSKRKR